MDKQFVIFDMDGVLLDSMPYWRTLDRAFLEMRGVELTEEISSRLAPLTMDEAARYIRDELQIYASKEELLGFVSSQMEQYYTKDVVLKAGAMDYLRQLRNEGRKIAVATATSSPLAIPVLKRLEIWPLLDYFQSCHDIGVGKDQPDIYLDCAREFGGEPSECAVFEDAPYAMLTAKAAGFYTILMDDASYRRKQLEVREQADAYHLLLTELLH